MRHSMEQLSQANNPFLSILKGNSFEQMTIHMHSRVGGEEVSFLEVFDDGTRMCSR